jgi:soluble lytic murein transglycosylase
MPTTATDGASLLLTRAGALLVDGDFGSALYLYEAIRTLYTGTEAADEALLYTARVYLEMGRPLSATVVLSSELDQLPQEARHRADFLLAEAFRQAGDCSQAIPYYLRYDQEGTALGDLVAEELGWCYRALGDQASAAEAFARAASHYRSLSDQVWMLEEAARDLRDIAAYDEALLRYERILAVSRLSWYRARVLYWMGEVLQEAGRVESAVARWQEVLATYPGTIGASWAADALLAVGAPVDAYSAGQAYLVAGRTYEAWDWLERALQEQAAPSDELRYAVIEARADVGELEDALAELDALSQENPTDPFPLLEKGRLLGASGAVSRALEAYQQLAQRFPQVPEAGEAFWLAGRLLERQNHDDEAVTEYVTLLDRFPDHERAPDARFRAGLLRYQQGRFVDAAALWGGETGKASDRAALWQGVALDRAGRNEEARLAWGRASLGSGYYAARSREWLSPGEAFGDLEGWLTWGDANSERVEAEQWLAVYWGRPVSTTLPSSVQTDPFFVRGQELLSVGAARDARQPFSLLVERFRYDGPALYALSLYLRQHHLHAQSIRCAERIVRMASREERDVPSFLLRLLYPAPYAHLIVPQAEAVGMDPLLFFALARQESRFDRYATSWAEARGLTQVIPPTGEWIAERLGFSPFRLEDLYRPVVSVRFGVWYLAQQLQDFEGQAVLALAAYNGGPGNALRWAGSVTPVEDLDLFVEAVDFHETRDYIERIYTSYWTYRRLYGGTP